MRDVEAEMKQELGRLVTTPPENYRVLPEERLRMIARRYVLRSLPQYPKDAPLTPSYEGYGSIMSVWSAIADVNGMKAADTPANVERVQDLVLNATIEVRLSDQYDETHRPGSEYEGPEKRGDWTA